MMTLRNIWAYRSKLDSSILFLSEDNIGGFDNMAATGEELVTLKQFKENKKLSVSMTIKKGTLKKTMEPWKQTHTKR